MSFPLKRQKPSFAPVINADGPADGGRLIVLTAPLTESIDNAPYLLTMALVSSPMRIEGVIHRKHPKWRYVGLNADRSARYIPAAVLLVEKSLPCAYRYDDVVAC